MQVAHTLDVSQLSGIIDYDPAELVLTARAATPMATIAAALERERQMFAFEPPDWRALLGGEGEPTLGGVIACNLGGPRRVRAGAARDHFLGFSAINGWGDAWKAGGRVVKNVTGYDMGKLQAGAYGTLSVLTEVSMRVAPRPETQACVLLANLADADAAGAMLRALNTPHEVAAAAHLPAELARRSSVEAVRAAGGALTVLRLEGHAPSVAFRADALAADLAAAGRLDAQQTQALWHEIAGVAPLLPPAGRVIWRVCPTPAGAGNVIAGVRAHLASAETLIDWGGGLVWLSLDAGEAGPDGGAAAVRAQVARVGGHAALVAAPAPLRACVPVFEPEPPALAALTQRVKESFDPRGIFNPGRMHEGR